MKYKDPGGEWAGKIEKEKNEIRGRVRTKHGGRYMVVRCRGGEGKGGGSVRKECGGLGNSAEGGGPVELGVVCVKVIRGVVVLYGGWQVR